MEIRGDAVEWKGRYIVPTTEKTLWVTNWEEFKKFGGTMNFSEDQIKITLSLPAPYKFSIKFQAE